MWNSPRIARPGALNKRWRCGRYGYLSNLPNQQNSKISSNYDQVVSRADNPEDRVTFRWFVYPLQKRGGVKLTNQAILACNSQTKHGYLNHNTTCAIRLPDFDFTFVIQRQEELERGNNMHASNLAHSHIPYGNKGRDGVLLSGVRRQRLCRYTHPRPKGARCHP